MTRACGEGASVLGQWIQDNNPKLRAAKLTTETTLRGCGVDLETKRRGWGGGLCEVMATRRCEWEGAKLLWVVTV